MFEKIIKLFLGFSVVGFFSTIFTIFLSYILLEVLRFPIYHTYFGIYIMSISTSYLLNINFVFKTENNFPKLIKYFIIYFSGMILGGICLHILYLNLNLSDWITSLLVLPITTIWNFTLSLVVLKD